MKKQICCRCLTESKTGYGNFNRCITIAENLKKKSIETIFLIDNNNSIITQLTKKKFKYFIIPKKFKKNNENSFISQFMIKEKLSTIILDMRQYGESLSKYLKKNNHKVILIDDVWSKKIYSDLFFNSTNIKTVDDYDIKNMSTKIFLGLKYWPIDKHFLQYRKKMIDIRNTDFLNLVITMGGSDPNNLTYDLLKIVKSIDRLKISVIVGPMYKNLSKLKSLTKNQKNITFKKSPKNFLKELSKADIAISNGGNTLFELIALRIPTICIPAFKHEIAYAKKFSDQNCIINLGFQQKNKQKIQLIINQLKSNIEFRKNIFRSTTNIIDGNGIALTSNIISNFIKK